MAKLKESNLFSKALLLFREPNTKHKNKSPKWKQIAWPMCLSIAPKL
jgi:hypothetical protein